MSRKEIFILLVLIIIAFTRFLFFIPKPPLYTDSVGKHVKVEGLVVDTPDVRLKNQHIILKPSNQKTNILLVISRDINISYGDMVVVNGVLEEPENFITSSGKEFNYKRYLSNQNIYFIIKNCEIEVLSSSNGNKLKYYLYNIRKYFLNNINNSLPFGESGLASGLILGARGGFDNETKDKFISTGTIHIVALSGYNITIVVENVMKLMGLLFSEILSILFGFIVIVLFILMAGVTATSVRAGIMASIMLLGRMTGRVYDAGRALVVALLLMITYDPRVVTDISFQLSFLATFGVLFITPKIIKYFYFIPIRFGFRELIATTISATISVLPTLLYSTGIFSLVSLPTNILILPFIPLTMFFSFIVGLFGFISPIIVLPFAYIAHLLLSYILYVVDFFASLSFASFGIKSFPLILVVVIYLFILWWVFRKNKYL